MRHPVRGGQKQGRKRPAEEEVPEDADDRLIKYHRDLMSQGWAVPPPPQTKTSPRELMPAEQAYIDRLQESIKAKKESLELLKDERVAAEALVEAKSDSIKEVKAELARLYMHDEESGKGVVWLFRPCSGLS